MIRFTTLSLLVGASLVVGCSSNISEPGPGSGDDTGSGSGDDASGAPSTTGSIDNTFDHENDGISVFDLIQRLTTQGPPEFTSHVHSCTKVRYANLANILASVGVDTTSTTQFSAGALYKSSATAEGVANYANRVRENVSLTTSGASAMFDTFAAAAPEVLAKLSTLPRCQKAGVAVPALIDANGTCNIDAISCLIGINATQQWVDTCNQAAKSGSTPTIGQQTAVAALLAAAYTCE
jgi:hypothetical protein